MRQDRLPGEQNQPEGRLRSEVCLRPDPRLKLRLMLKWSDVLNLAKNGNPVPDRRVVKKDGEWRARLTEEEYYVTRKAGTESAFSSEMCSVFEPAIDSFLCCDTVLFDASEKFESNAGLAIPSHQGERYRL